MVSWLLTGAPEQRYWQNRETANVGLDSSVGRAPARQSGGRRFKSRSSQFSLFIHRNLSINKQRIISSILPLRKNLQGSKRKVNNHYVPYADLYDWKYMLHLHGPSVFVCIQSVLLGLFCCYMISQLTMPIVVAYFFLVELYICVCSLLIATVSFWSS